MHDEEPVDLACIQCGLVFGMDDVEDLDNVHCPECDSTNVSGGSEILGGE